MDPNSLNSRRGPIELVEWLRLACIRGYFVVCCILYNALYAGKQTAAATAAATAACVKNHHDLPEFASGRYLSLTYCFFSKLVFALPAKLLI